MWRSGEPDRTLIRTLVCFLKKLSGGMEIRPASSSFQRLRLIHRLVRVRSETALI